MSQIRIKLTDELLQQVVGAVAERTGNVVGQKQINMIESRLTKRAMTLGLKDEKEYLDFFLKNRTSELEDLISILTVHHTYFFREFGQFEFLGTQVLPGLVAEMKKEGRTKIRIWSAACSRGQEAYSLYMFIEQFLKLHAPTFTIEILGTDVDRESVKIASNGVYDWNEVKEIPMTFLSQYWTRGTGDIAKFAKIKEAARKACVFKQSNLMETESFGKNGKFDIIFCRNVFIYFQTADVTRIAEALRLQLNQSGFLFVGLSESLVSAPQGLKKRGPSIYGPAAVVEPTPIKGALPSVALPIRVLCVDDSPTIIKLLKSILTPNFGFEVVGTAGDGVQAALLVDGGLKFDVMTLDVHMPNMGGVEYLEEKMSPTHPPVVMLTSASRENMDLAYKAMKLGAKDYIEKPSLSDLAVRSDEIRSKLRLVGQSPDKLARPKTDLKLELQFKNSLKIKNFSNKMNIVFGDERSYGAILALLKDPLFIGAPSIIVNTDESAPPNKFFDRLKLEKSLQDKIGPLSSLVFDQKVYFASMAEFKKLSAAAAANRTLCYSVFTNLSRAQWEVCPKTLPMKLLLSEEIDRSVFLSYLAYIVVTPATSFAYMSSEFFGQVDLKVAG